MKTQLKPFRKIATNRVAKVLAYALLGASVLFSSFDRSKILPVILQDEYIYLISAKEALNWGSGLTYDFGNYLFNLLFWPTTLCGADTYACAKTLNSALFLGAILLIFNLVSRYAGIWIGLGTAFAISLSPTAIYASMFLPETLFFLITTLILWQSFDVFESDKLSLLKFAKVGVLTGVLMLVKPHALMSVMAFAIFIAIYMVAQSFTFRDSLRVLGCLVLATLGTRLILGLILAGPKSINIFNSYGAAENLGGFVAEAVEGDSSLASPASVALSMFPDQIRIQVFSILALVGLQLLVLFASSVSLKVSRISIEPAAKSSAASSSLMLVIWLGVLLISIALFAGWVTGGGDDHSTRALLRYYDFLIPHIAVVSVIAAFNLREEISALKLWIRFVLVVPILLIANAVFTGFFETLTVQIADAPYLAGLIVSTNVLTFTSVGLVAGLLVFLFFPRFLFVSNLMLTVVAMSLMGIETAGQYEIARSVPEPADKAGKALYAEFSQQQRDSTVIVSTSRFSGRVASFWMQTTNELLLVQEGTLPSSYFDDVPGEYVLAIGDYQFEPQMRVVAKSDGYTLYYLND